MNVWDGPGRYGLGRHVAVRKPRPVLMRLSGFAGILAIAGLAASLAWVLTGGVS